MTEILIPKETIVISGSSLNSIQLCAMRDHYENVLLLRPFNSNDAMEKGTLMHKVLEIYYKFKKDSLPNPVDAAILGGRKLTVELELPIGESEEVIKHFIQYVEFYSNEGWDPLHVEESFSVLLYEDEKIRILYEGTIDLIAVNTQGIKLIVDHKTGSRNKIPLGLSNQFMGYCFSLEENLLIINKILFYKAERKLEDKFRRYPISYSDRQLTEWKEQAINWGIYRWDLLKRKRENPDFQIPMNLTSCDKYGHCLYAKICSSIPGDAREYTINTEYKVTEISHDEERFKDDD